MTEPDAIERAIAEELVTQFDESGEYLRDYVAPAIRRAIETHVVALVEALWTLDARAWGWAMSTCSEFCVHDSDPPESCPMNWLGWAQVQALLVAYEASTAAPDQGPDGDDSVGSVSITPQGPPSEDGEVGYESSRW